MDLSSDVRRTTGDTSPPQWDSCNGFWHIPTSRALRQNGKLAYYILLGDSKYFSSHPHSDTLYIQP